MVISHRLLILFSKFPLQNVLYAAAILVNVLISQSLLKLCDLFFFFDTQFQYIYFVKLACIFNSAQNCVLVSSIPIF
jgi:hypothetical protein